MVNKLKWDLRRAYNLKKIKIGHAGTLDPMASGLLLVCVGSATKSIERLQAGIKEYTGTMVLGATTPCFDMEQGIDRYYPTGQLDREKIVATSKSFVGEQEQVPPIYSAVKVDGKRAYFSAREGNEVEITAKRITIYQFEIEAYREGKADDPLPPIVMPEATDKPRKELYRNPEGFVPEALPQIDFRVTCSKGTYIRSLARDMGMALDSGAFLCDLRRTRIGDYSIEKAMTVEQLEEMISEHHPFFASMDSENKTI